MDNAANSGAGSAETVTSAAGKVTFRDIANAPDGQARETLIAALVARMTLSEKVEQMSGSMPLRQMIRRYNETTYDSGANDRLGIPAIRFTDGPRGVALNRSTCFPCSMARGASWDPDLEARIGDAIGVEARAQGANFFGGVCVNVLRHPAWGRAQETYGEDPCHIGVMGAALVRGAQRHVMACVKHFAANSIEDSRFFVDVRMDERTLREVYLPHFRACVKAGAASVMSAYNSLNGSPCGHNRRLLRDILKKEWNFDGIVMSDFTFGLKNGRAGLLGGLDIEMPCAIHYGGNLKKLVREGEAPAFAIDEAVTRILRQKARFASVGEPERYKREAVACEAHRQIALEAAEKGMVLLKNAHATLPLNRSSIRRLAVFGELAKMENIGDRGSSAVYPPHVITAFEGIEQAAGPGVKVEFDRGSKPGRARRLASQCDAAVVVAGCTWRDEGEGGLWFLPSGDRKSLYLDKKQEQLILTVAAAAPRTIVVLEGGSAFIMENWIEAAHAALMAWYPGMMGGLAIGRVLFGDASPGGRLPLTIPRSPAHLPDFQNSARRVRYGYLHGYKLLDSRCREPRFAFGHGLGYTSFEFANLQLDKKEYRPDEPIGFSLDAVNTGARAGDAVPQIYIGYRGSKVERPLRELKAFARVTLQPGETRTLRFTLDPLDLAYYNTDQKRWHIEEIVYQVFAGASSREADLPLRDKFRIMGE